MPDQKRLLELRALHIKQESPDGDFCRLCGSRSNDWSWPCEAMQTIDLALEAERLKQDGGSLAQRELKDHYEREFHRAFAEAERLRAQLRRAFAKAERLRVERDDWMRAAMAGAAHICCEECQSECDHVPGFGFDAEMYDGSALAGTEAGNGS